MENETKQPTRITSYCHDIDCDCYNKRNLLFELRQRTRSAATPWGAITIAVYYKCPKCQMQRAEPLDKYKARNCPNCGAKIEKEASK